MNVRAMIDMLRAYAVGESTDCQLEFVLGDRDNATLRMTGTEIIKRGRFVDDEEGVEFEPDAGVIRIMMEFET